VEAVIIADDLTGANDSGVQFAHRGLTTSVLFKMDAQAVIGQDAIVLNTDSRSCSTADAYERVVEAAKFLRPLSAKLIYKKIDSILRGNIGAELDAMYDVFQPDFLIVAPAYPDNGRTTVDGVHYLNGTPVHETELGADQKTPVTESYIPALLTQQTNKQVALITYTELRAGKVELVKKLSELYSKGIAYLVSDAENEADLCALVEGVEQSGYRVIWAGSAGLAKCLPIGIHKSAKHVHTQQMMRSTRKNSARTNHPLPVLVVVGSMTTRSHTQLQTLLASPNIVAVKLQSELVVAELTEREREIRRICGQGIAALSNGRDVVVLVSTDAGEVADTIKAGKLQSKGIVEISNSIAEAIGEIVSTLLHAGDWAGVVMTGGDTAARICDHLGTDRFELIDEVESGVPIGLLCGELEIQAITKAGSFGTDEVLLKSVTFLKERTH
jgi:uncharacterized protein YgbK (DUF1537 family)